MIRCQWDQKLSNLYYKRCTTALIVKCHFQKSPTPVLRKFREGKFAAFCRLSYLINNLIFKIPSFVEFAYEWRCIGAGAWSDRPCHGQFQKKKHKNSNVDTKMFSNGNKYFVKIPVLLFRCDHLVLISKHFINKNYLIFGLAFKLRVVKS